MGKNEDLFWQLIEKEHKIARAFCLRLTGNIDTGDDLYQDAVIQAYNGFNRLKNVGLFRPWLYRIINNAFKSRFRNVWWKRVMRHSINIDDLTLSENPAGLYEARRRLNYALSALSADDRFIVALAELESWKISELAELLSKTEGFVKMRLSRARKKMRKRLGSLYRKNAANNLNKDKVTDALFSGAKKAE